MLSSFDIGPNEDMRKMPIKKFKFILEGLKIPYSKSQLRDMKNFYNYFKSSSATIDFPMYLELVKPELFETNIAYCFGSPENGRLGGSNSMSRTENYWGFTRVEIEK